MDINSLHEFITLILLNRNDNFKNSYSLNRVLEWKFQVFPVEKLKKEMMEKGLMNRQETGIMYLYDITELGKTYIKNNFEEGKRLLFESFPDAFEFLNSLFEDYELPA
ncbi:hypothetical protein [Pedobacter frigiditerrae]|uniref:hypothetical protein n=1 Tax=Pedobacter frigiditerrae TaxID=2530452 RepID=UPI0029319851|nr:hypothetical protein [Pedobacter frigiditerrae]